MATDIFVASIPLAFVIMAPACELSALIAPLCKMSVIASSLLSVIARLYCAITSFSKLFHGTIRTPFKLLSE